MNESRTVRDAMTAHPSAIGADATAVEAARVMSSENVGSLPVVEGDELRLAHDVAEARGHRPQHGGRSAVGGVQGERRGQRGHPRRVLVGQWCGQDVQPVPVEEAPVSSAPAPALSSSEPPHAAVAATRTARAMVGNLCIAGERRQPWAEMLSQLNT